MTKVTIILPVYNVENYLRECLDSVTGQTLEDIEILCVNDGSTDGSLSILEEYAGRDERVRVLSQANGGYGKAMNAGLSAARGEYIGIVEPDDYVPLNMYEELYACASEHDLDLVKADFYRFRTDPETGEREMEYFSLSEKPSDYNKVFTPSEYKESLFFVMNTWSGIYRRSFLEKYKIRHNETPGASFQDNGFFFQTFAFAGRAMILDRPYYCNRRDNPGSSVYNPDKVYTTDLEYDHIRRILEEHGLFEEYKTYFWKLSFDNDIATLKRIGDASKREYMVFVSERMRRAGKEGGLDRSLYNGWKWRNLQFILRDPVGYALTTLSLGDEEGDGIQESTEYRTGLELYRRAAFCAHAAGSLLRRAFGRAVLEKRSLEHRRSLRT